MGKLTEDLISEFQDLTGAVTEGFAELAKNDANKETLAVIEKAFSAMGQIVSKMNKVDITPLANILSDISKQNNSLLDNVGRLIHSSNNKDLVALLTKTADRSNEMVALALEKTNSEDFKAITQAISDTKAKEIQVVRDNNGWIQKAIIHYTTTTPIQE